MSVARESAERAPTEIEDGAATSALPLRRRARGTPAAPPRRATGVREVLRAVGSGLIGAALIVILMIAAAAIVVPALVGGQGLAVMTGSMAPSYPAGTFIIIRPVDPATVRPGEVVTYQLRSGEPEVVTHRVTQRLTLADGHFLFITQGDANPSPDVDPVREVQIRGTLWYAIPYLGWVSVWLTGPWKVWAIPVAAFLLFGYALTLVVSHLRDRRRS